MSEEQYNNALTYIKNSQEKPPVYAAFFCSQCDVWANNVYAAAKVKGFENINMNPENIFKDFGDSFSFNPYVRWIDNLMNEVGKKWDKSLDDFADNFLPKVFAFNKWVENLFQKKEDGIDYECEKDNDPYEDKSDENDYDPYADETDDEGANIENENEDTPISEGNNVDYRCEKDDDPYGDKSDESDTFQPYDVDDDGYSIEDNDDKESNDDNNLN